MQDKAKSDKSLLVELALRDHRGMDQSAGFSKRPVEINVVEGVNVRALAPDKASSISVR
jgi:hypothetical protein